MTTAAGSSLRRLSVVACLKRPRPEWHGSKTSTTSIELISTSVTERFAVPLSIADVHLRQEQLPFAYFFKESLCREKLLSSLKTVLRRFPAMGGAVDFNQTMSIECSPEDSIPVSFADSDQPLEHWMQRGHLMFTNGHPTLLPLFDPLFASQHELPHPTYPNLASIKVTSLSDGWTVIGLNINHMLADAASCFYFIHCWGSEMQNCTKVYDNPSNNRSMVTCSGMMTHDTADVMGLLKSKVDWMDELWNLACFSTVKGAEVGTESTENVPLPAVDSGHVYTHLAFPLPVLLAMKAHGMAQTLDVNQQESGKELAFVSTNDMLTALGWLMKRELSGNTDWNMSMVVNLRGRCGIGDFGFLKGNSLFGNGIFNVIAALPISESDENSENNQLSLFQISEAAFAIRNSLTHGLVSAADRISSVRAGQQPTSISVGSCFSTTSWTFPIWDIKFGSNSTLVGFHGHPSHPIPRVNMFASVIVPTSQNGGMIYQLLIPTIKAKQAKAIHLRLCAAFLDWQSKQPTKICLITK